MGATRTREVPHVSCCRPRCMLILRELPRAIVQQESGERVERMVSTLLGEAEAAALVGDWVRVEERCRAVLALQPGQEDAAELTAAAARAGSVPLVTKRSIAREPLAVRSSAPAPARCDGHRWGLWAAGMAILAIVLAAVSVRIVVDPGGRPPSALSAKGAEAMKPS